VIIPNKKGVEIVVKKIFKLLFPFDEKLTDSEIPDPGNTIKYQLDLIFTGLIPENEKVMKQFLDILPSICAEVLKKHLPDLKIYAVEPALSAVLSGGQPGPHPLQGLGAGFVPSILKTELLDGIIKVGKDEAYDFTKRAAKEEGLFVGISTGAVLAAVNLKLRDFAPGSRILTFNYDTVERYLTTEGLF
jgi:cysteine synthase A